MNDDNKEPKLKVHEGYILAKPKDQEAHQDILTRLTPLNPLIMSKTLIINNGLQSNTKPS